MLLCIIPSLLIANKILAPAHTDPSAHAKQDSDAAKIKRVSNPFDIYLLDKSESGKVNARLEYEIIIP